MTKYLELYDRNQADNRFVRNTTLDAQVAGLLSGSSQSTTAARALYASRPVSTTVINTTPLSGEVTLASVATVVRVQYSAPTRFRLYRTAAGRNADAARPFRNDYLGGAELLYEYLATDAAGETDLERPVSLAATLGSTKYFWQADGAATVTIDWIV